MGKILPVSAKRRDNINEGPDRVRFRLGGFDFSRTQYARFIEETFGFYIEGRMNNDDQIFVLCTPEDFTKFLIERDRRGFQNGWKVIQPAIIHTGESEPRSMLSRNIQVWDNDLQKVV